jgi:hypothetical protein
MSSTNTETAAGGRMTALLCNLAHTQAQDAAWSAWLADVPMSWRAA